MRRHKRFNRICSRLLALTLAAVLVLCMLPAASAAETEGTCGAGLAWSFADGTLTITGSGAMTDYTRLEDIPWYGFRDQIIRLSLPEGLTRVGNMAFYDCSKLASVILPSTVREIGELAFCQCTGITILQLNEGLQVIGRSAFEQCVSLQDLRLPSTVTILGRNAFYYCTSIRYVVVPESVASMDSAVFACCENLIRAEINASLPELPYWTFYGCTALTSISLASGTKSLGGYAVYGCGNLNVVYYGGEAGDANELHEQITQDNTDFGHFGFVVDQESGNTESSSQLKEDANNNTVVENTTVTQTEDVTVSVTTTVDVSNDGEQLPGADITATVVGSDGWQNVMDAVRSEIPNGDVNVNVFIPGDAEVPQNVVDTLAGTNVTMNVQSGNGSAYVLDFRVVQKSSTEAAEEAEPLRLDLSYMLFGVDSAAYPEFQGAQAFRLVFNSSSTVPAEVMIQLPVDIVNKHATLFQMEEKGGLTDLQSVVTDRGGVAHFYLGAVDSGTEYFIGINVPGVTGDDVIIPDNMQAEYGVTDRLTTVEYVITGRTSSWGMSMGQVGGILAGVMLVCVIGIGAVMFGLNRRKLRRGYIPELDDDET